MVQHSHWTEDVPSTSTYVCRSLRTGNSKNRALPKTPPQHNTKTNWPHTIVKLINTSKMSQVSWGLAVWSLSSGLAYIILTQRSKNIVSLSIRIDINSIIFPRIYINESQNITNMNVITKHEYCGSTHLRVVYSLTWCTIRGSLSQWLFFVSLSTGV